jgi:uncharacterized membrane protein
MRAYDIALFAMCLSGAVILLAPTGLFIGGPSGITTGDLAFTTGVSLALAGLITGGIAFFGVSFKQVAVIGLFQVLWQWTVSIVGLLFLKFVPGPEGAGIALVIGELLEIIGLWATFQVAAGPATVNE